MSLQDRISAQSKLDNDLMLQNDRISRASRPQENTVLPFKQVDEELLREYNSQFSKGFEYTDDNGNKKYRKFIIPQDEPELDETPELEEIPDINYIEHMERRGAKDLEKLNITIRNLFLGMRMLKSGVDRGLLNQETYVEEKRKAEEKLQNSHLMINTIEDELRLLNEEKRQYNSIYKENEAKIMITQQKNKQKIEKYKEELNILNSRAFTTEQLPSETEQEYFDRLKLNAEITEPEENLYNAKQLTLNKFKEKMKEIIRDPVKVEQICNTFDIDFKLKAIKGWTFIKKYFEKNFGLNNTSLTIDDIIGILQSLHEGNKISIKEEQMSEEGLYEEDEDNPFSTPFKSPPAKGELKNIFRASLERKYKNKKTKDVRDRLEELQNSRDEHKYLYDQISLTTKNNTDKTKNQIFDQISNIFASHNISHDPMTGFGLKTESIPEKVKFGKLVILLHKLYYKNILSVKHHNMISIAGLKNTKVSEKFVKLIMGLVEGIHPTITEINGLSTSEKQLYDRLIHLASLNKMIPHTQDKTINDLKKRMKLIEGEIQAGNNSPILLQDLYVIVHSLKDFGVLSQKDIKQYLQQF